MGLIERETPRKMKMTAGINPYAHGSVLVEFGQTKVHVTAICEETLPNWLKGQKKGWVTAEYAMLPASTHTRSRRERKGISGRSQEIQRLIGRSLRSIIDLKELGERSITIDCDVLVADGGTRTASVSGAWVALRLCINRLLKEGVLKTDPIKDQLGAISVGINKNQKVIADLNYIEDSSCETDMNIVMTRKGEFVEVQGTAEGDPFSHEQLLALLDCAKSSLESVFKIQNEVLKS